MNFDKVPMYSDGKNTVYDVRDTPYSIFGNESKSKYLLYPNISYGKDYPSGYADYDIFRILNCIKITPDLNAIFSKITLESSFSQAMMEDVLLSDNLIEETESSQPVNVEKEVLKMDVSELSNLLKKHGITASGKKKKLVKLAIKNIPGHEFGTGEFKITSEGEKFLDEFNWISLYGWALEDFEFNDFYKYIDEHDGDSIFLALNFVDEHFALAKSKEDFEYYDNCYKSRALVYFFDDNDLNNALKTELERFIIRLNPEFLSYGEYYVTYLIFNPENIYNIKVCLKELDIDDLETLFNEIWNSINFKKEYVSSQIALEYLEKLLDDEDFDELSEEFNNKYFETYDELFNIGKYLYRKGDYSLAADYFDFSLEIKPGQTDALYYKAMTFCEMKDYEYSMEIIDEAIEIDSQDSRLWNIKAICAEELGESDNAVDYFDYSIILDSNNVTALNDYAIFFARNEEFDSALEYFDKAIEADKTNIGPILYKAKVYIELKDWENAEACYREAQRVDGENELYFSERAMYYVIREDFKKAIECCDECLKINGNKASALLLKTMSLLELGDEKAAEECRDKLSKTDSNFIPALGDLFHS